MNMTISLTALIKNGSIFFGNSILKNHQLIQKRLKDQKIQYLKTVTQN